MAITDVQICNLAFNRLGHEGTITSIGESTTEGEITLRFYTFVRDALLGEHTWNFCVTRVTLSKDAVSPAFEYTNQYLVPANMLAPVGLYNEKEPFKIEVKQDGSTRLLTDAATANLIYLMKQTDVAQYSPSFVDALVTKLAAEMAEVITHDSALANRLFGEAELKLKKAKRKDGQAGTPGRIKSNGFTSFKRSNLSGIKPPTSY